MVLERFAALVRKKVRSMETQPILPKIILFGDSLTAWSFAVNHGLGKVLTERFQDKAEVLNRGRLIHCRYQ